MALSQLKQGEMVGVAAEQFGEAGIPALLPILEGKGEVGKGFGRRARRCAPPQECQEREPQSGVNVTAQHRKLPLWPDPV
jgi:hypothetical protein